MRAEPVNLADNLPLFDERWSPKVVASFNGHDVMVVEVKGRFVWRSHPEKDEFFVVLRDRLTIELRDGAVSLGPGEIYVAPRGMEHRPKADQERELLLIEPAGTPNTGDPDTAAAKTRI